jgi:hypothetical protein
MHTEKTCPIMPKHLIVHFHPEGTGRDLYIAQVENSPRLDGIKKDNIPFHQDFN